MALLRSLTVLRNGWALTSLRASIASFLREFRHETVLYHPNPGNAGDSLIAVATLEAFRRAGVTVRVVDLDDPVEGHVVFLGGGGNFVPLYHQIAQAFAAFLGRARRIVLLPHTIRGNEDLLRRLDSSCTIFCRDEASAAHVRSTQPNADVRLAHDMAFHLDALRFLRALPARADAEDIWRERLAATGLSERDLCRPEGLDLSRLDAESRAAQPRSDADISALFSFGTGLRQAPIAAWCFLRTIGRARRIYTDRLHVGISAALLGVPCELRDNTYGKNAAVFATSMAGRFANVRLVSD